MTENGSEGSRLVSVLEARNELEAITIQAFLESQGIDAAIRSRQIPMYDGIAKVWNPVWGYVMVMEEDREKAEQLIVEYLDSCDRSQELDCEEYADEDMDL
ncbi:MAG: hypothetical protein AVO35_04740 [Candidatus Aegiribacteria sp. MLS_C]|nr:MAG: hypothetical protein AVO35_04740 [Candidatus Aegiribacteria sp. MLS_C]